MASHATSYLRFPDGFWIREEIRACLHKRDIQTFFNLVRKYTGTTQLQLGEAVGLEQGYVSKVMAGARVVERLEVFERIADGTSMPDSLRIAMGIAPRIVDS